MGLAVQQIPSYASGFARYAADSAAPELWHGLLDLWAPALGATGLQLLDWGGRKNYGTLTGMDPPTDWIITEKGMTLDFDGVNDRINLSRVVGVTGLPFSVFALYYAANIAGTNDVLISDGDVDAYHGIRLQTVDSALTMSYGDGGGEGAEDRRTKKAATALASATWYSLGASVRGATDMSLYVDGVDDGGAYSGTGGAYSQGTTTGHLMYDSNLAAFSAGRLALLLLWNCGLSAQQMALLAADPSIMLRCASVGWMGKAAVAAAVDNIFMGVNF